MSLASAERAEMSDLFEEVGTDAPTLCDGWTSKDLLAHLLMRERQPWAAAGIMIPQLSGVTERAMKSYEDTPWAEQIADLRSGPPIWSLYRAPGLDARLNGLEFFVHHEDLRRGSPGWQPRPPHAARDRALWNSIAKAGKLMYRKSPVGVVLRTPEGATQVVKSAPRPVTVVGEPAELVLHAFGRDAVQVELQGDPADVSALAGAARGV